MFTTRKDLEAQLASASADVERLETELAAAQTKAEEAIANAERITELSAEVESLTAQLTTEQEAHTATKAELEAEQAKTTPEAIQALVTEELAKAGHEPLDDEDNEDEAAADLHAEYRNLQKTDPRKAAAFWEEHKDTLLTLVSQAKR